MEKNHTSLLGEFCGVEQRRGGVGDGGSTSGLISPLQSDRTPSSRLPLLSPLLSEGAKMPRISTDFCTTIYELWLLGARHANAYDRLLS